MTKIYDELTGKALRNVNKAKKLTEKYIFNFDGNQEQITWDPKGAGFLDFQGFDPISSTVVEGGLEYDKKGKVLTYAVEVITNTTDTPTLLYGLKLKKNGFKKHLKAADKKGAEVANITTKHQGDWNAAGYELVNWLDNLPGAISKRDDSTYGFFEGYDTIYA